MVDESSRAGPCGTGRMANHTISRIYSQHPHACRGADFKNTIHSDKYSDIWLAILAHQCYCYLSFDGVCSGDSNKGMDVSWWIMGGVCDTGDSFHVYDGTYSNIFFDIDYY